MLSFVRYNCVRELRALSQRAPDNSFGSHTVRPFLRWAGGKQKLAASITELAPARASFRRYFEPFLGGGSVFFRLRPNCSILGDINAELCNCYDQIRTCVEDVIGKLSRYAALDSREFYNRIRARSTEAMSPAGRAARFIYLIAFR
jgi:DNA adenine methylase